MKEEQRQLKRALLAGFLSRPAGRSFFTWASAHPAQTLTLIVLLGLSLGIVKLWIDPPNAAFNWENRWWQIALNVARGHGYVACKPIYFPFCGPENQVTGMREPLPVLVFALIALLTEESLLAAAATGVVFNLLTVIAVYYLARELADTKAGLLAALLWAIYLAPIRYFYAQVSGDLLATLGLTGGMFFLLRARRTGRWSEWLAAGACLGLASLSRSAMIIVAPALAAGLLLWPTDEADRKGQSRLRKLAPVAVFLMTWFLILAPWFTRNYIVFGHPVAGSTLSGYYLYRQNHILVSNDYLRFVTGGEFVATIQEMVAGRQDLTGNENEAEMDQVYRQEALKIIRAEPLRYAALSGYRFTILWFNWKVDEAYGNQRPAGGDYLIMIQHALFLAGGVVGLQGRWRRAWPLAASVAAMNLLYMAVMALITYVVPMMALLVALSAIGLARMGQRLWADGREAAAYATDA